MIVGITLSRSDSNDYDTIKLYHDYDKDDNDNDDDDENDDDNYDDDNDDNYQERRALPQDQQPSRLHSGSSTGN